MKYTIEGFNQAKAVELELCVADLIILRWFVDFSGTDKMVKRIIDNTEYFWIKYDGILEDLPILAITKDTRYRRLKGLVEKGILEHITVKEAGTYSFYKLGKKYLELITDSSAYLSEKNPTGYGKKSDRGTEKNPYQNTNLQDNTPKPKKDTLPTVEGEQALPSKKLSYNDVYSREENKVIRDALIRFVDYCKGKNYNPRVTKVEEFAKVLRDNSHGSSELASRIVQQSISNGWKALYPLKDKYRAEAISKKWDGNTAKDADGKEVVY